MDTYRHRVSLCLETFVPSYFDAAGPAVPSIPAYLPHQNRTLLTGPSKEDIMQHPELSVYKLWSIEIIANHKRTPNRLSQPAYSNQRLNKS